MKNIYSSSSGTFVDEARNVSNTEPTRLVFICDFQVNDYLLIYLRRGFLEGDPNALKADDAALRGEESKVRFLGSNFFGRVGVWNSSIGPLDSWRIWTRCPCTW